VSAFCNACSPATTAGITTTTGNLVVLSSTFYRYDEFTSVSDNGTGNTWTQSIATHHASSFLCGTREDYNASINGKAGHTFSLTLTNVGVGIYPTIAVTEISGASASPLDKTATGDDTTGTSHTTASTGTLTQAKELALGAGGVCNTANPSVTTPWTELQNIGNDGNHEGIEIAYQIVNSTSALTFTYSTSANSDASFQISTWKEAAAASTPSQDKVQFRSGNIQFRSGKIQFR